MKLTTITPSPSRGMYQFGSVVAVAVALASSVACGPKSTTRMVDDPVGKAQTYGGPKNTSYQAQVDTSQGRAQVTVFESSECDVIPVAIVQRYQETLHGDEVVQRTPVTKKQVAEKPQGSIRCNQTYSRNVEVFLAVGDARHKLGLTDAQGRVQGDFAQVLGVGSYEQVPDSVSIALRPLRSTEIISAGQVSMTELKRREGRIVELLGEIEKILAQGETGASSEEIGRSYEIYAQLNQIAPADPRVLGISARFWELYTGRKLDESRVRMEKNLKALGEAKDTLKVMGDAAVPIYVQAAVNSGNVDPAALEWASVRLIRALRAAPMICSSFNWGGVSSYGWDRDAVLAAQYVQYARGNAYDQVLAGGCR